MAKLKLSKPKRKNKPKPLPLKNIWVVSEPGRYLADSGIPCKGQSKQAKSVPIRIKKDFKKGEEE